MSGRVLVVTVAGGMDPLLRSRFDDVEVSVEGGVSRLRVVTDPSQLHGILHRLDALGVEVIDIRPVDEMPGSGPLR